MKQIIVYTDGSSRGNPGPGGLGVIMKSGKLRKEISQGFRLTTNNRMELMAVIVALEAIKSDGYEIIIHSDSKYVVDAVREGWVWAWEKKGFKNKKNPDLWKRFLPLFRKYKIKFKWVKGHAGNPENERCDELAVKAAGEPHLREDTGYVPDM